jgi:hypothetical protein
LGALLAPTIPFLFVVASLVVMVSSLTYLRIGEFLKLLLYPWFIVILLTLTLFQIHSFMNNGPDAPSGMVFQVLEYLSVFSFGAIIFSFLTYVFFLFSLLPPLITIFSPHIDPYLIDSAGYMITSFSEDQIKVSRSLQIILAVGGSVVVNGLFNIVPLYSLVSLWLMVPIMKNIFKKNCKLSAGKSKA